MDNSDPIAESLLDPQESLEDVPSIESVVDIVIPDVSQNGSSDEVNLSAAISKTSDDSVVTPSYHLNFPEDFP